LFYLIRTKANRFLREENGEISAMVWVIGAAVVVVLVITGAMVYLPQTTQTIWTELVGYITSSLKF